MIDLRELEARLMLHAVATRISEYEEAWEVAQGLYEPSPGFLTPPLGPSAESRDAWARALRRVRAQGPRVVATLVNAAVGEINWGGNSTRLDDLIGEQQLLRLAKNLARDYHVAGLAAGYAYEPETGAPRIGRLTGYIEPYTHPMDADVMTGLYQAKTVTTRQGLRYWVRVWDFEDGQVREWRALRNPTDLGMPPDRVIDGLTPRYAFYDLTPEGMPWSPFYWAVPMFRDLMASELFIARVEEYAAYPIPRFGPETEVQQIAPGLPVQGEFEWSAPGSLAELREQRAVKLERLRDAMALPGGFLGNDSPSGEALREANQRFYQEAQSTARTLSELLTQLVGDLAALAGADAVEVTVLPNRDYIRDQVIQGALTLYEKGVIPLEVAAREVQPYLPTWSDEELNQWIESQKSVVTMGDVARMLGGGNA